MTSSTTKTEPVTTKRSSAPDGFSANPARGRFNAAFFWLMGGYIDWHMHKRKAAAFADLPPNIVEVGSGVGANLRYLPSGEAIAKAFERYLRRRGDYES